MFNPDIHHRKSIRKKGYDYSQTGYYFVTFFIKDRVELLATIEESTSLLNEKGIMLEEEWIQLKDRFDIELHNYIIMPDHIHGIIQLKNNTTILGDIIGAFKSITTDRYIENVLSRNWERFNKKLWHRNFYEEIIKDEAQFDCIKKYIVENPLRWGKKNDV